MVKTYTPFMVLIYTFYAWNNKSFKFLRQLPDTDIKKMYIHGVPSINRLITHIQNNKYTHIIGLGDYRKNAKQIRIETKFVNQYGKSKLVPEGEEYFHLDFDLESASLPSNVTVSDKPTISNCNRSAYLILDFLAKTSYNAKFYFIHIPRKKPMEELNSFWKWLENCKSIRIQ